MMRGIKIGAAALAMSSLAAGAASAKGDHAAHAGPDKGPDMAFVPGEAAVRWEPGPPSLPKGVEVSQLSGDPSKPGPFVLRVRVPANTVIAPHTHATAETLTILKGSIQHDMGRTLDRSRGKALTAGGFVYLPGDMPHALWTTDGPVELQVNGTGPFGLIYVDPNDDPGRKG